MEQQNAIQQENRAQSKTPGTSRRGFASMDKERHKLVSSKGGKSVRSHFSTGDQTRLTPTGDKEA